MREQATSGKRATAPRKVAAAWERRQTASQDGVAAELARYGMPGHKRRYGLGHAITLLEFLHD